jgi:hypothetical protein
MVKKVVVFFLLGGGRAVVDGPIHCRAAGRILLMGIKHNNIRIMSPTL